VNSRNAATAWWQHHKHCPGIIIIIIIISSTTHKNKQRRDWRCWLQTRTPVCMCSLTLLVGQFFMKHYVAMKRYVRPAESTCRRVCLHSAVSLVSVDVHWRQFNGDVLTWGRQESEPVQEMTCRVVTDTEESYWHWLAWNIGSYIIRLLYVVVNIFAVFSCICQILVN